MSVAGTKSIETSAPKPTGALLAFWNNPIGKKALMSLTGIILSLYVLAHLLGNMQIYMGSDVINRYAELLHTNAGLLWTARVVLLVAVGVHAIAGVQLYLSKASTRPIAYAQRVNVVSTTASRTMIWSGILIFAFVIYHVLDLTVGVAHLGQYEEVRPFQNVTSGFTYPLAVVAYVVAMVGIGFHLWHGLYSLFQSLGMSHPRYTPMIQKGAAILATLIALANISVPIAVLTGLLR
ncbi:succinate dehydrogenase cytochrome b subunit [Anaeromyxobacter paludicola]|uniref:Succinate dehydrogenase n=1 Tax=Anaeromyxobacter paludicola TaxID=2918171 RepID=A0ABM7X8L1_9BACT|nr:succinate dehydrogenase cytochrome b subunit [Anaeromyxobacter paludicola]BDG08183.1 succinate dehydrogenase [Anaeromyxobacter paludicola]